MRGAAAFRDSDAQSLRHMTELDRHNTALTLCAGLIASERWRTSHARTHSLPMLQFSAERSRGTVTFESAAEQRRQWTIAHTEEFATLLIAGFMACCGQARISSPLLRPLSGALAHVLAPKEGGERVEHADIYERLRSRFKRRIRATSKLETLREGRLLFQALHSELF